MAQAMHAAMTEILIKSIASELNSASLPAVGSPAAAAYSSAARFCSHTSGSSFVQHIIFSSSTSHVHAACTATSNHANVNDIAQVLYAVTNLIYGILFLI